MALNTAATIGELFVSNYIVSIFIVVEIYKRKITMVWERFFEELGLELDLESGEEELGRSRKGDWHDKLWGWGTVRKVARKRLGSEAGLVKL